MSEVTGIGAKKHYGSFPLNFDAILTFGNAATLIYFPFLHSPTCSTACSACDALVRFIAMSNDADDE